MSKMIWDFEGVKVTDIVHSHFEEMSLVVEGVGEYKNELFTYTASVTPQGWLVKITPWSRPRRGEWQGPTFNLPLEVAAAVRRLL